MVGGLKNDDRRVGDEREDRAVEPVGHDALVTREFFDLAEDCVFEFLRAAAIAHRNVTWVIYLVYLHLRIRKGWSGRTAALFGVAGFVCVLFTYIGVNTLLPGLHSYK